jgi:hypothetical protein
MNAAYLNCCIFCSYRIENNVAICDIVLGEIVLATVKHEGSAFSLWSLSTGKWVENIHKTQAYDYLVGCCFVDAKTADEIVDTLLSMKFSFSSEDGEETFLVIKNHQNGNYEVYDNAGNLRKSTRYEAEAKDLSGKALFLEL